MSRNLFISVLLLTLTTFFMGCNQTKYVPQGKYLLKKNVIEADKSELSDDDLSDIIRQQPNYKTFGFKIKLAAFNMVDSAKVAEKRIMKNEKIRLKNQELREKEIRVNERRIEKAKRKNSDWYTKRVIPLKDSVDPKMFLREWLKYKFGEPPVVFDSSYFNKSVEQLDVFLRKKGYYYGTVSGEVQYGDNRKAVAIYHVHPQKRYYIDSFYIVGDNKSIVTSYQNFLKKGKVESLNGKPFDSDMLDDHRSAVADLMRDESYYKFNYASIDYEVDTTRGDYKVSVGVRFGDRVIQDPSNPNGSYTIPYRSFLVNEVYFHINDTLKMKGMYGQILSKKGLPARVNNNMTLLDTLRFEQIYFNNDEKKKRGIPIDVDSLNINRIANFYYNGKMFVKPGIIELQNYLEKDNYYKQYYLERSYSRLLQLDIFEVVRPELIEIEGTNRLDVHYHLEPSKKQNFSFEPKATNSNGFLGVSASLNYNNKNLFRGAEKFTFSLSGGFESQPLVFNNSVTDQPLENRGNSFNSFEFEPGVKLDMPGLLPIRKAMNMAKRQRARTIIGASMNFQNRGKDEFDRRSFQFNYAWRFAGGETQVFTIGLPFASVIRFVDINPKAAFIAKLNQLNDNFLRSTYSDQFIWQDWKITYEYNTTNKKAKRSRANIYFKTIFDPAGNLLSLFNKHLSVNDLGQRTVFNVGYSQFLRLDNEVIFAQPINKKSSYHMRFLMGAGMPYGNTNTAMPFDYGFFGGGANDNRGWRARTMAPGVYKYYLDTNRTITQIGDIRIAASAEYRFDLGGYFKGAVFTDVGNVWSWNDDANRSGAQFSKDWFKQLYVSGGIGLRMDLDFFIIRLDMGVPLLIPSLPSGSQWIFQPRSAFNEEITNSGVDKSTVPKPFTPVFHFGIGYPF